MQGPSTTSPVEVDEAGIADVMPCTLAEYCAYFLRLGTFGFGGLIALARSVVKLVRMTLAEDRLLWAMFIANGVLTAWTESEVVWAFALSGITMALVRDRPQPSAATAMLGFAPLPLWALTGLHGVATVTTLGKILAAGVIGLTLRGLMGGLKP
ncbi:MAG TPA: hypothetical protein VHU80_02715 [Polyangiaceae bacterium]|nr:hypothetical protein [Polyangiaceae bacterium]